MPQVRQTKPDEYESILRFLAEAYGVTHNAFPRNNPSWWGEYMDFSRTWVMARKDRIESLVRIFPLNLVLGEVTVEVGGIGAVSTLPSARGQGHMHHLIYRAIEEMKEEFALSVLWGDRHRYRLFGYENGGSNLAMKVGARGLAKMGVKEMHPQRYWGELSLLKRIQDCHSREPFRRLRREHEDALLYNRSGLITWTGGSERHFGYLVLSSDVDSGAVIEFGGHPLTVLGLAAHRFATSRAASLRFVFPLRDAAAPEYWEAASEWSIEAAAMIKILHLSRAIELFRPWLTANPDASDPALAHLSEAEMVERLFGVGRPGAAPFFCWPLDQV